MTDRPLTDAQARALLWLPADGAWTRAPRPVCDGCDSLSRYHRALAERRQGLFGARGGWITEYHLTDAGIAARAMIESYTKAPPPEETT